MAFLASVGQSPRGTGGITQGEGVATFFGQQLFKVGGGKRVGQAWPGPEVAGVGVGNPGGDAKEIRRAGRAEAEGVRRRQGPAG